MAKSIDAVTELLQCSICVDRMSDPKTLPCEHSFCAQCLADTVRAKIIKKDGEVVLDDQGPLPLVCPICNAEYRNFQSINSFKTSLLLKQLLDAVPLNQEDSATSSKIKKCFACERPALLVCIQCDVFVCKRCHESCHITGLPAKEKISKCKNLDHYFVEQSDDGYCCKLHRISADLFCTKCDKIICLDCFFTEHKDHKTKTVKSSREDVKFLSAKCKSIIEDNARSLEELEKLKDKRRSTIEINIASHSDQLKKMQLKSLWYLCKLFDEQHRIIDRELTTYKKIFLSSSVLTEGKAKGNEDFLEINKFLNSPGTDDLKVVAQMQLVNTILHKNQNQMKAIEGMLLSLKSSALPALPPVQNYFKIESFLNNLQSDDFYQPNKIPKSHDMLREIKKSQIMKEIFFNAAAQENNHKNCKDTLLQATESSPSQKSEFMQRKNDFYGLPAIYQSEDSVDQCKKKESKDRKACRIVYDREFLLKFRNWTQRPVNLPDDLEIVLPASNNIPSLPVMTKPRIVYSREFLMRFRETAEKPHDLPNGYPVLRAPGFVSQPGNFTRIQENATASPHVADASDIWMYT